MAVGYYSNVQSGHQKHQKEVSNVDDKEYEKGA